MNEAHDPWKYVRGLERLSLCDWPGRPSAVLFLGGCNLRCPTCHNWELAWNMEKLPQIPDWRVKVFLAERKKWLDGVTITGGEPTCVPGLGEIIYEVTRLGLPVKLDTNGMRPDIVAELLEQDLVHTFAVDVKGPYRKYPELTGNAVTEEEARENLQAIFALAGKHPDKFYFRCTRVPALDDADVEEARTLLPEGFSLTIQEYVAPRRSHAHADHEERRPVGDLVH